MKFEKTLDSYSTSNAIMTASKYLNEAIERMLPKLKKMTGLKVYHEVSRVSFFSNYIEFCDNEFQTIFKIRISDHTNNEPYDDIQKADIRINGRMWKEVKKEIISEVQNVLSDLEYDDFISLFEIR